MPTISTAAPPMACGRVKSFRRLLRRSLPGLCTDADNIEESKSWRSGSRGRGPSASQMASRARSDP
eukprot:3038042-Pyramimonas_sp.AAC.1